jgi:hypothetical protein
MPSATQRAISIFCSSVGSVGASAFSGDWLSEFWGSDVSSGKVIFRIGYEKVNQ